MSTKALFPWAGGLNLILGTGKKNKNTYFKNSSRYQVFHQIL